jgi:hypothetical protein
MRENGAGGGNRTLIGSLEGYSINHYATPARRPLVAFLGDRRQAIRTPYMPHRLDNGAAALLIPALRDRAVQGCSSIG